MTDNELLQAISGMIDGKLESVLENMATKADLEGMATKADLEGMATKADLEGMATKADLEGMATKADLENMATKADLDRVFDELMNTEKWVSSLDDKQEFLTNKVDMLLLKSDNTALLLQLINKQGIELETVKERMNKLEKRIS